MDSVTETSSVGLFGRLGQSLISTLLGLLMVPGSIILLYWNEGRAVDAYRALSQGQKLVQEADAATADARFDGHLVHISGLAQTSQPARDDVFGVSGPDLLRISRKVKMYQWKETKQSSSHTGLGGTKTTTTTYDYTQVWSESPINSEQFKNPAGHVNPEMPLRSGIADSADARLGAWRLDSGVLAQANNFQTIPPTGANNAEGFRVDGQHLYRGANSNQPAIGDVRVDFLGIAGQTLSVVAGDAGGTLAPYRSGNGYVIALLQPGVADAAGMFGKKEAEEGNLTWILRGVGFVMMLVGFMMISSLLTTLASAVPFFGGLVEAGVFIFGLAAAVPITLLTIAIAWVAHRPLLGVPLIVAGVAFFVLMHRRHRPVTVAA
jgi:hypothetical protein